MAKAQATETLLYAGDRAVQFHGGMGFTYECDAQLYIRRAQWSQQQYGDAQHHRKRLATLLLDGEA
jgi:alkylation response protein AidB-like acyl-CoA dehydrogenase